MIRAELSKALLIEPTTLRAAYEEMEAFRAEGRRVPKRPAQMQSQQEWDVVPIAGVLLKTVPDEFREYGFNATGYDEIADMVGKAASSKSKAILLNVNSPGGMVDGIDLALSAIRAAAKNKKVVAYVDGTCTSAAYWLTSQADMMYATRFSSVGGIGCYSVAYDTSGVAEKHGLKAMVSRSGAQKGMGIFGDPITEKMKEPVDEIVDQMAAMFLADVTQSRADVEPEKVNSGRTWLAAGALQLSLIDGLVEDSRDIPLPDDVEEVNAGVEALTKPQPQTEATDHPEPQPKEDNIMSEEITNAVTAERERVKAITQAFASDPEFARKHIDAGSTLDQAKAEHYDVLQARQSALTELQPRKPIASAEPEEAPVTDFMALARKRAYDHNIPLHKACEDVAKINRAAYLEYLGAHKEG